MLKIISTRERDSDGNFIKPPKRESELLNRCQELIKKGWEIKGFAVHYGNGFILMYKD